ncbi:MAG: zinc-ribbon domain-containing protein [Candidatus Micrarchaeia archaeon]
MAIYQKDVNVAKKYLWQDEQIQVTATQRKIGPGGSLITPTTVVLTNKRILLINRATFGLRKDVESIPYSMVASVRVENGFISSSVFLRVGGYSSPGERGFLKPGEQEGEISGLRKIDASALADFVERVISNEIPVESVYTIQQNSASNFVDNSINTVNTVKKGKDKKAKVNTSPKDTASNSGSYIYCNKCGAKNDINANFCSQCGAKLK